MIKHKSCVRGMSLIKWHRSNTPVLCTFGFGFWFHAVAYPSPTQGYTSTDKSGGHMCDYQEGPTVTI